ncbi:5-formyltetrahydrofolate cyclo-ligase [Cucumibacter marinus]|uniref:5-formyltetrahydrofolate cyclo-ligase n=1 Tax=Cucumibacter marinus TaxID=1121252 RepID=UPI00048E0844|nr:5-formyltetrahydrofolate cyclo-ligase [Cucumibacter marinus]
MSDIAEQKSEVEAAKALLRTDALEKRRALSSGYRDEAARDAAKHFLDNVPLGSEQTVALYWPIRDELDVKPLITRLMDDFHAVCLPLVMGQGNPLEFRRWELGAPLFPAGLGTLEPAPTAPLVEPDLIVMPLVGWDKRGTRLGYGGGYYDITLGRMTKPPQIVGYAFAAQEIDEIPREEHDIPLNMLVTERGFARFGQAAG